MGEKSFLIIQPSFIGDVILTTPVIHELHRIYPDASIDILVRKGNESLVADFPGVRHVFLIDRTKGKLQTLFNLMTEIRKFRYDEVINFHRFGSSGIITLCSRSNRKIGFDKNPFSWIYTLTIEHVLDGQKHEVERNLQLIAHHGAANFCRPELNITSEHLERIKKYTAKPFVCLFPASVWFTKQWPESGWIALAKELSLRYKVYIMGGPDDQLLGHRICEKAGLSEDQNLCGKLSLMESAALLSQAVRCFVNDSAPLHMASATNTPTTVFFCSTVPSFGFGPLATEAEILEHRQPLPCRPCGIHGKKSCPQKHFRCAQILVDYSAY